MTQRELAERLPELVLLFWIILIIKYLNICNMQQQLAAFQGDDLVKLSTVTANKE